MPTRPQGKILIIRGGAIGDFILTLPVLAALRQQFPQAHLEVLGYPHIAQLALMGGLADQARPIEARALAGFFAKGGTLDLGMAGYFASFALIISYLYDPDEIFQENVARCADAQFIAGPHRPDEATRLHATDILLKPLERLAIFSADSVPRLALRSFSSSSSSSPSREQEEDEEKDARLPRIALHPGSGSEAKNWPETKWAELLQRVIAQTDWEILLVGGEAEAGRLEGLARLVPVSRLHVAQSLPLNDLAVTLQRYDFFLGHDSGITHLAAAAGLRGLALWGHSNRDVWHPRSERFEVLEAAGGLTKLEVDSVFGRLVHAVRET